MARRKSQTKTVIKNKKGKIIDQKLRVDRRWLEKELTKAFFKARRGKLRSVDEFLFEMYWHRKIEELADDIISKRYRPSRGIAFIVTKPVRREIFAAPFRDRVVHHLIYNLVYDWWDQHLIDHSFSCRVGKGTLYGIKALQKDMRRVSLDGTRKGYVLKFDLQGYFMSLPRSLLYERALWGLKRQFSKRGYKFELVDFLWKKVIFDDPVDGVRIRPSCSEWADLPSAKSLFCQPAGFGIVIGNLSSQLLSNIYLDQLDRYITMQLGYKHYGRYVDDFYIVITEKELEQAKKDIYAIEHYLKTIGLTLHPRKRYIQEIGHGCEFLGMKVSNNCLSPSKRFKGNYYVAMKEFLLGIRKVESVISYMGYSKHMNAGKFCRKIMNMGSGL